MITTTNGYFSISMVIVIASAHRGFNIIYNLYSEKLRCNHRFWRNYFVSSEKYDYNFTSLLLI